jgi:alpha-N-arabinofuranosidase
VWQLGRTDLKYYVLKHNEFAKAMRAADPSITLLASGNMPLAMDLIGEMRTHDADNLKAVEGTPVDWTGGLLQDSWGNFSGITQHWYAQPGRHVSTCEKAKNLPLDAPTDAGYDKVEQTTHRVRALSREHRAPISANMAPISGTLSGDGHESYLPVD